MARILTLHGSKNCFWQARQAISALGQPAKSNFDKDQYGLTSRDGGASIVNTSIRFDPVDSNTTNRTDLYFLIRFRMRRAPSVNNALVMDWGLTGGAAQRVQMFANINRTLTFCNSNSGANLFATSAAINAGTGDSDWTTIYGRLLSNATTANLGVIVLNVNGVSLFDNTATPGSVAGVNTGINSIGSLQTLSIQTGAATNDGIELDIDQFILDTTPVTTPTRHTYIPIVAAGNYTAWAGGNPQYQFRNNIFGPVTQMTTASLSARQSYQIESLRTMGITGSIISATIFGFHDSSPATATGLLFYRKGGVDTDSGVISFSASNNIPHRALFDASAWTPDDVIEIGVRSGTLAGTYSWGGLGIVVEHTTPYVAPVLQDVIIQRFSYAGTGALQTQTLPFVPTFIMISPRTTDQRGAWGGESLIVAQETHSRSNSSVIVLDRTKLHILQNDSDVNSAGVTYDVLCVRDEQNRVWGNGGFYNRNLTSPYDTDMMQVTTPMASPTAILINKLMDFNSGTVEDYWFGPGQANDNAISLDAANYVNGVIFSLNATGFISRKSLFLTNPLYYNYFCFKPGAFESLQLLDVTTYTGDGGASKVVPLSLAGATPVWVFVFPHNNSAKYYRNNQQAAAKNLSTGGAASATVLPTFAANSITVAGTLNTNLIVYTVLAIAEGTDSVAANQYSGIYYIDPNARHETLWDRTGAPVTTNLKITPILVRTAFIGDR